LQRRLRVCARGGQESDAKSGAARDHAGEFPSRGHEDLPKFFGSQRLTLGLESMLDGWHEVKALLLHRLVRWI
jgi:hypothetical protein